MNNPIESYQKYGKMSYDIGKFDDIQSQLKEGWEILLGVKAKYGKNHELYEKFEREYQDLYNTIKKAFDSEKAFSQEQRDQIKMELSDMVYLAEKNGVVEKKIWYSKLGDVIRRTNTNDAKTQTVAFRDKKIKDYSLEEAIVAMKYTSDNYSRKDKVDDNITKGITFMYSTINELDDQYEVRLFQEELIKKIFPDGKQFNEKYILGFDSEQGNYIVEIGEFEKKLKGTRMDTINSKALANYFLYVASKKEVTSEVMLEILSPEQYKHLLSLWKDNKDSIAQKILSHNKDQFHMEEVTGSFFEYYEKINTKDVLGDIQKDPSKVYLISDKKILLDCIKNIKGIKYENINSYMQLDIDVIIEISKKDSSFDIKSIPQSFFEISGSKDDIEKIKNLFLIGKNESDYLKIISELSVSLGDKMDLFMNNLSNDKSMKTYKSFFRLLGKYKKQMDSLTNENFTTAYENLLINRNSEDIITINLYVYKHGIQSIEEKVLLLLGKNDYSLEDFPGVHKYLYTDNVFAQKLISKYPKEFKNLSATLQSDPKLIDIFLDAILTSSVKWNDLLSYLEQIQFGKDIGNIILIYNKLVNKYGEEKANNLLGTSRISQKMHVFLKNLEGSGQSEGQKKALANLNTIFGKIVGDYGQAKSTIDNIKGKYEKNTTLNTEEKDILLLEKISEITGFKDFQNKEIFDLIKKESSEINGRLLYNKIKEFTGWKSDKTKEIFTHLQKIQLEEKKQEIAKHMADMKESGIEHSHIDEFLAKNAIQKNETEEQYKKRILEGFIKEQNTSFSPLQKEQIQKYIQDQSFIKALGERVQNIAEYIQYVENPEKFSSFKDYKEAKLSKELPQPSQQKELSQQISYPSGNILEYVKTDSGYNIIGNNGENIIITPKEFNLIKSNEEAKENLINFKETLQELNLDGLWKYRESIFTAVSSKYTGVFNVKEDFINENEMKVFVSSVLSSLGISVNPQTNMADFKQQVKDVNKVGLIGGKEEVNVLGDGYIEDLFLQKFDSKRSGIVQTHVLQNEIGNIFA